MNTIVSTSIYRINSSNDDLILSMSSGKGQATVSSIYLNHQLVEGGIEGGFKNRILGKNKDLNNALLTIDVIVQDINPDTNATLVNLSLSGGEADIAKKFTETIDADWGQIMYHITFFLKA
jgi:hypothetical protein